MPNPSITGLYAGLESSKRAFSIVGADRNAALLQHLESASRAIEQDTKRVFFPYVDTNLYRWPSFQPQSTWSLWTEWDLLSVTALQAAAQNSAPIALTKYFLEPQFGGPPYSRIEVDLSSTDVYQSGNTPQRSISIAGLWGYSNTTVAAGTVQDGGGINASVTSLLCSDASLIDTGDVLLIGSEALYVSGRSQFDTTATLNGALNADKSQTSVPISNGALVHQGEQILVDSESMYVTAVTGNTLTVLRAYDGSTLAAHLTATHVYAPRTLTVVRGVNGTTAATHANGAAVSKYVAPADIRNVVRAEAASTYAQEQAAYGRVVGAGDMAVEFKGAALKRYRDSVIENYGRLRIAAI